jgi:hypothetical protein
MADTVLTNTYLPAGPGKTTLERESLRDVVEMVAIDMTPLYSNLTKVRAGALLEEWGTEDIGTIVAAPARSRGFVAAPQAPVANRRLSNYLELNAVEFGVSDSMDRMPNAAGNTNTMEHQRLKWAIKLRRQLNKLLHTGQVKSGTEPTTMATFPAYIAANFKGVATTPGVAPTGDGTNLPTAGTTPVQMTTITPIDDVMELSVFTQGTPNTVYMHPHRRRQFSKLPDANLGTFNQNQNTRDAGGWYFVGTVSGYLGDFGELEIVVDNDTDPTCIELRNHDYEDLAVLPGMDFDEQELGRRGSGREMLIQHEATYRNLLPEAHAYINGYVTFP